MANIDPKQVIIDYLAAPAVTISEKSSGSNVTDWRTVTSRGGMKARTETIQFSKQRVISGKMVQHVTFENVQGMKYTYTCYLTQDELGRWKFAGGSGGGIGGKQIIRTDPWINVGGGGWPDHFFAGGYVIDNGLDIVRVCLVANNGTVLEDTVQDGIVLFLATQKVELPLQAQLYDRKGVMIASHKVFH